MSDDERRLRESNRKAQVDKFSQGVQLLSAGDLNGAIAAFTTVIAIDPDSFHASAADHRRAEAYLRGGALSSSQGSETIRAAGQKSLEGWRLLSSGDYEGAIAACTEAIKLLPHSIGAYRTRAEAYERLGRKDEAEADAKAAEAIPVISSPANEPADLPSLIAGVGHRSGVLNSIDHSLDLMGICWKALLQEKKLIAFPLISFLSLALVALSYMTFFGSPFAGISNWPVLYSYYVGLYFLIIFFNCGLIYAARTSMFGGDSAVRAGLVRAMRRLPQIFLWAALSATVGVVLWAIELLFEVLNSVIPGAGVIGDVISTILGLAWGLATYFVAPILVIEGLGPLEAVGRSTDLFRRNWGTTVRGNFGLLLAFLGVAFLFGLAYLVIMVFLSIVMGSVGLVIAKVLAGVALAGVVLAFVAMNGIYKAALYEYAASGRVPEYIPQEIVRDSWTRTTSGHWHL